MDLNGIVLSEKKSVSKGHVLYDSISLKWQNYRDGKELNGGQGLGMVGTGRGASVTFEE